MQSSNRILGDLARMASGAMSMAAGAKDEVEQLFQQRFERFLNEKGWVNRDEFEAVRALAQRAREEQERLNSRLELLESKMAKMEFPKRKAAASKNKPTTASPRRRKNGNDK